MKLARFTAIGGVSIIAVCAGLAAYNEVTSMAAARDAAATINSAFDDLDRARDIAIAIGDIKFDVVEVQQFLTDVSATRALDGLDDGFSSAADYATKFAADLKTAQDLAARSGDAQLQQALVKVGASFPAFFDTGKKMAQAYVDSGPAGGNGLMPVFDTTAQQLSAALDAMQQAADAFADALSQATDAKREVLANQDTQRVVIQIVIYAILVAAIALMTIFMAGYTLRRIRAMSKRMTAIAAGDYSQSVHGSSVWEELKDIATAADIFRQNGLQLQAMTAEEAEKTSARRAERAAMMGSLQMAFGRVVDAAIVGDFSQRVAEDFADRELNVLAGAVNTMLQDVGERLRETGAALDRLAHCDLSTRMTGDHQGAFGQLRDDLNAVADRLAEVVTRLIDASGALRTATGEILAGANDLSDRTTRQAATIEQTSASMDQLTTTIGHNSELLQQASATARSAAALASESGESMKKATAAMDEIAASSQQVQNFIGVIDDIAFQTNLLALNASVEAARAGDAGKGFAVVAVEVRRLAQSAAEASREAKALVEHSATRVGAGASLVDMAATKLSSTLASIAETARMMDDISLASRSQAVAVEEVNVAVRQMDEMIQHNAALVEETNAAIEQTEAQARILDNLVSVFSLGAAQPKDQSPRQSDASNVTYLQRTVA